MAKVQYYHLGDKNRLEETVRAVGEGKKPSLWRVEVGVTSNCNLACDYCRTVKVPDKLTAEVMMRIVEEAGELGARHFHFTGGEPTVRDDLPSIIGEATKRRITTSVITNGASRNESSREYAQALVAAGVGSLTVSLDTSDPERNDGMVGVKGAWQRTVNFLGYVHDARQQCSSDTAIYVNTFTDRETIFELPERIRFYGELGVIDDVKLLLIKTDGTRFLDTESFQRFRDEKLERVLEFSREYGFDMFADDVAVLLGSDDPAMQERTMQGKYYASSDAPCYLALTELFIASNGDVYNCRYHFWHLSPEIRGNVTRQSLVDIWETYNPLEHSMEGICEGLCTRKIIDFNNQVVDELQDG